ncbi:MAG: hypothetical protein IJV84_02970 [Bacteroidales bacterium]|nr:hypothetical protein [Bacteroidales bacterium]
MASYLQIENISKSYGPKILFDQIMAAEPGKRQEVSSFSASYLQDSAAAADCLEAF